MRTKLIVGNWKMNKTVNETIDFLKFAKQIQTAAAIKGVLAGIAPSYLSLPLVVRKTRTIKIYAQNCSQFDSGAYTGEVSTLMLQDIGVQGSLIGHSERRIYDNETSKKCNEKIIKLLDSDMEALYCVGENLDEYKAGKSKDVVKKQIIEGLKNLSKNLSKLIIAYEPVWSIGTGVNASVEIAEDICSFIREQVRLLFSASLAENIIILYGGSVKPENIKEYLASKNIDGALVGGASLKPDSFLALINNSN